MPLVTVSSADIPVLHSAEVCTLYPRVVIHSRKGSLQGFQTGSSSIPSPSEVSLPSLTRLKYSRFTPCPGAPSWASRYRSRTFRPHHHFARAYRKNTYLLARPYHIGLMVVHVVTGARSTNRSLADLSMTSTNPEKHHTKTTASTNTFPLLKSQHLANIITYY